MSLPVATRTITVLRAGGLEQLDAYDTEPGYQPVATVRGVIGDGTVWLDPLEGIDGLTQHDRLVDDAGVTYAVESAREVTGLGLDHVKATVRRWHQRDPWPGEAP